MIKPVILLVEDNPDLVFSLEMTLELNNYDVITASNGNEAMKILSESERLPDLILSDIMMPMMDGYDFFKEISNNIEWNLIPFIFLTAKSRQEDVNFGKMLGVDDYLTKPVKEEELLATIAGKLIKGEKAKKVTELLKEKLLKSLKIVEYPSVSENEKQAIVISSILWDENKGPVLKSYYPPETPENKLQMVGMQLFKITSAIYGQELLKSGRGVLLFLESIDKYGYIYFDFIVDKEVRTSQKQFMLAVIAPKISYLDSLGIEEIFKEISVEIKENKKADIMNKYVWEKISAILTSISTDIKGET